MLDKLKDLLRASPWLAAGAVATVLIALIDPEQAWLMLWFGAKVSFGAWLGYWIDRSMSRNDRPHTLDGATRDAALLRRAVIVAAAMLAFAMAV